MRQTEAEVADIQSRMYVEIEKLIACGGDSAATKPLILCEYLYAMGNGPRNANEYLDVFYKYPRLHGGCVWQWANQGKTLCVTDQYIALSRCAPPRSILLADYAGYMCGARVPLNALWGDADSGLMIRSG